MRALLYNRGYGSVQYRNDEDLLTVALTDQSPLAAAPLPAIARAIAPSSGATATPVAMTITLPPVDAKGHS